MSRRSYFAAALALALVYQLGRNAGARDMRAAMARGFLDGFASAARAHRPEPLHCTSFTDHVARRPATEPPPRRAWFGKRAGDP